jgi:hypothetical protein
MWKAEHTSTINGSIEKAWEVLITPSLWSKADPKHYKEVTYTGEKLAVGSKGKMKTEDSPGAFGFKVVKVDPETHTTVTKSGLPLGSLTLTKSLFPAGDEVQFDESVVATGPFAKLFAKKFFQKQIADTLPAQHEAIKKYVEGSK